HKGTKTQRKPASNDPLGRFSLCLCAFVSLCCRLRYSTSEMLYSVKRKRVQRIADCDQNMLLPVDDIRFGRVGAVADTRMPQRLPIAGIECHEIAAAVPCE